MFTGIVEELGRVRSLVGSRLEIACVAIVVDSGVGSSVAVNGACLTVVANGGDGLAFDVSDETFARTSLGGLREGDPVNLERPVSLVARLGGHLVQGHVDGVGMIDAIDRGADGARLRVMVPGPLMRYTVEKGSLAVDGVSLTIARLSDDGVEVALIPHTLGVTTFGTARPGMPVNLEVDLFARYVERLMERS